MSVESTPHLQSTYERVARVRVCNYVNLKQVGIVENINNYCALHA